jgi:uncharacterized protein YndB with AHSA1/START domain
MTQRGRYVEPDGRPAVCFERTYAHSIERVWSAVTEPDQLVHWFPSSMTIEPRVGGAVRFSGDPHVEQSAGIVLRYDPPHRFAFTWGENEVHLELESLGDAQCRLRLTDILSARDTAARNAAGWTVCLGELDRVVADQPGRGPHSELNQAAFSPLYAEYVADGMPDGAG